MDTGSLDERPVALSRRVVDCQGEPPEVGDQRLDYLADQAGGDVLGLLAGGRDRRVAGSELGAQASGADPTVTVLRPRAKTAPRNSQASLGADLRSRNAARRENHWHGGTSWCEDVMAGSVRFDG